MGRLFTGRPNVGSLTGAELVPVLQEGTRKNVTTQGIANLAAASGVLDVAVAVFRYDAAMAIGDMVDGTFLRVSGLALWEAGYYNEPVDVLDDLPTLGAGTWKALNRLVPSIGPGSYGGAGYSFDLAQFVKTSNDAGPSPVAVPAENVSVPTITGTHTVGSLLTGHRNSWLGEFTGEGNSYTYRWLRDDVAIEGETGTTYTLTDDDIGTTIKFEVTGENTAGADTAESAGAAIAAPPVSPPTVVGGLGMAGGGAVGRLFTADTEGTFAGTIDTITYQWLRNGSDIDGATASTYRPVQADSEQTISVRARATNTGGYVDATSSGVALPTAKTFTFTFTASGAMAFPALFAETDADAAMITFVDNDGETLGTDYTRTVSASDPLTITIGNLDELTEINFSVAAGNLQATFRLRKHDFNGMPAALVKADFHGLAFDGIDSDDAADTLIFTCPNITYLDLGGNDFSLTAHGGLTGDHSHLPYCPGTSLTYFNGAGCGFTSYPGNGWFHIAPTTGHLDFSGNAFPEGTIDSLLGNIVDQARTGSDGECFVDLSGGTNAPPSSGGLAFKAILEGNGWTVLVNS